MNGKKVECRIDHACFQINILRTNMRYCEAMSRKHIENLFFQQGLIPTTKRSNEKLQLLPSMMTFYTSDDFTYHPLEIISRMKMV